MRTPAIRLPPQILPAARRVLAWALLAMIPWLLWQAVAPVIAGISEARERSYQARALLARYDALISQVPALEARLAVLDKAAAVGREPVDNGGAAPAAAKLQTDLQRMAGSAGVTVRNSQVLPSAEEAGFLRIGTALELSADAPGLQRLLHAIENAQPPLFVNELVMRADPGSALVPSGQPILSVRCQVVLYAPVKPEPKTR